MKIRVVVNGKEVMMRESELVFILVNLRSFFCRSVLVFWGMVKRWCFVCFSGLSRTPLRVLFHFCLALGLGSSACVLFLFRFASALRVAQPEWSPMVLFWLGLVRVPVRWSAYLCTHIAIVLEYNCTVLYSSTRISSLQWLSSGSLREHLCGSFFLLGCCY